jgi:hypothetical protein
MRLAAPVKDKGQNATNSRATASMVIWKPMAGTTELASAGRSDATLNKPLMSPRAGPMTRMYPTTARP